MKGLILFFAVVGCAFAQNAGFENRYRAAEKELDSLDVYRVSTEKTESAYSSYSNSVTRPPLSVIVVPEIKEGGVSELEVIQKNPYSKLLMESVGDYFSKNNYDLKTLEGEKKLNEFISMQNDIAGKEDDLAYLASLLIGSDIYIKYSGDFTRKNLKIELKAYEAVTGVLLGSETDNQKISNPKALNDCIRVAAENASKKLEVKIQNYWKRINGTQYKVLMNISGEMDEDFIENLHEYISKQLPPLFKSVSFNVMTDKTVDMTVYAGSDVYGNSQEVYKAIRSKLKKIVGVKKNNITRKLILMDVNREMN